ncbi:hypothetical protein ES703_27333 [subsurface metagenome]
MIKEETKVPFRLYDFLAYLFPGAASMHAVYVMCNQRISQVANTMSTGNIVIDIILGFIAAYLIGLLWSVLSREGLRRLVWKFYNPRIDYFFESRAAKSPLGVILNKRLREKVQKVFGNDIVDAQQAHRLCRVFVSNNSPASWERRESIIGVRAMCANCVGPVLIYGIAFATNGWWLLFGLTIFISAALICKMIILDQREWKEIYFAFLVATLASADLEAPDAIRENDG